MLPNRRSRRAARWVSGTAAGLAALAGGATLNAFPQPANPTIERSALLPEFQAHYDGVLGTSMDLTLQAASAREAGECERQVLAEIQRLSGILSTYDPGSEISQVSNGAPVVSGELAELLAAYDLWNARTDGAIHANLGEVKRLWNMAQRNNRTPRWSALDKAFRQPRAFNIDALGKGFIIDRAVELARRLTPAGLLNIGGDIRVWGDCAWTIGIADPMDPADNAPPLAVFPLRNAAVASSGGYARYFMIEGVRHSHIIDPRTLSPVPDIYRSGTAIAPDCVTANALATAVCIHDIASARQMIDAHASGHLTMQAGMIHRGGVLAGVPLTAPSAPVNADVPAIEPPPSAALADARWMKDFRAEITVALKIPSGAKIKRPYVVVWIENESGRPIRNMALWGTQDRYLPHLSTWWKLINANMKGAKSICAATRNAGKYTLYWDGRTDSGAMAPQGTYKVHIEISREHGTHAEQTATIKCEAAPDSATLDATAESDEGKIEYKKKGAR